MKPNERFIAELISIVKKLHVTQDQELTAKLVRRICMLAMTWLYAEAILRARLNNSSQRDPMLEAILTELEEKDPE